MAIAIPNCRRLLVHFAPWALDFALLKAGKSIPARIAMMAITTNSSISVKPLSLPAFVFTVDSRSINRLRPFGQPILCYLRFDRALGFAKLRRRS